MHWAVRACVNRPNRAIITVGFGVGALVGGRGVGLGVIGAGVGTGVGIGVGATVGPVIVIAIETAAYDAVLISNV